MNALPIPVTVSRNALTVEGCPPALARELSFEKQNISLEQGSFSSRPETVSYAQYDEHTRICRTYPNALHLVRHAADRLQLELKVVDHRIRPPLDPGRLEERHYRADCFDALKAVAQANSSGLIVGLSGTDKTTMLCGLIRLLPGHFKVLVTTETELQAKQLHTALTMMVGDEIIGLHLRATSVPARIMVTHMDLLTSFTEGDLLYSGHALRDTDAWLCDEVHRLPVPSRIPILNQFRTVYSWGITATPERADNSHQLNSVIFGPVLSRTGHLEAGHDRTRAAGIVPVKALVFPLPAEVPVPEKWSLAAKIKAAYLKNPKLNLLVKGIDASLPENCKALVVADSWRQGVLLRSVLPHHPFVHGRLRPNLRDRIVADLKSGSIRRVICADSWSEEIDVHDLSFIIDCSAGTSPTRMVCEASGATTAAPGKPMPHYVVFLCLSSELLFNRGISKLETMGKLGWDVRFMFSRLVPDSLPFEKVPLLAELGAFTED